METDGKDDAEVELMEYGPGGDAAADGGWIKPEEMSLINKTRERGRRERVRREL
jgi:hypothetical protein